MHGIFFLLVYGVRHLIDQRKNPAFTSLQCIESSAPRMDDQVASLNGWRKKVTAPLARAR